MAAGGGKLMPNLDQQSTKMLNLTVLQRIDPFVEEILLTAAHVTFYEFNLDRNQWSRKDVEGSLFVVKRNTQPRFQFIVMNRRNTDITWGFGDNLVEDLLGDFEYEVQIPYLLYRNAAQEVNGIWFYNQQECEEIANLFGRILNAYAKVPSKPKVSSSKSEFEELEAVPTLAVIEGPLEPSSSTKPTSADASDGAFVNFFSTAVNMGSNSSGAPLTSHHSLTPLPFLTHIPSSTPIIPTVPVASPLPYSSNPAMSPFENADSGNNNRATNLVKPSFFNPSSVVASAPTSSTAPSAPPVHVTLPLQRPYGSPLLQPFPPPAPSPSLTPASSSGPVISRDKVRDALVSLAQNNLFIDMVYQEILNPHTQ